MTIKWEPKNPTEFLQLILLNTVGRVYCSWVSKSQANEGAKLPNCK